MAENDSCANTLPLTEWVKRPGKICRPCTLPLLTSWYVSELEEAGDRLNSNRLKQLAENPDVTPDQLAAELDNVKNSVSKPMKDRLREFDCSIQVNE